MPFTDTYSSSYTDVYGGASVVTSVGRMTASVGRVAHMTALDPSTIPVVVVSGLYADSYVSSY